MRSRIFGLLSATALALVTACQPAPPPTPPPTTGGSQPVASPAAPTGGDFKLNVGLASLISTMDPHASIANNPRRYGLYECLVGQDENGKLQPALATEWKNVDPTTWQFKLAQGRKFHDGNPVTAEDVKYSWDRAINPDLKLGILARTGTIASIAIVDPQTINIVTKGPDPLLLKRAALVVILEKAYVEKLGPADFALKAMGTGPYMQKEYVPNDRLVVVPSPYATAKPGASEITVRQIPELSARVAGIKTGDLDLISSVSTDQADQLKSAGFNVVNFTQGRSQGSFIFTNLPDQPTNNKLVRQALNYAVDKDAIAKTIFRGYTKPEQGQVLQATTVGFNPTLKPFPFDVAKAKQLLAQAGYPNGFKMKLDVYANTPDVLPTYLLVQSQLKAVGIDAEINQFADNAAFLDRWYGRVARGNTLSVSLLNSPAMDADFALVWFKGTTPEPQRFYNNPAFDQPYQASTTELNEAKRTELLNQAVAAMYEDPPYLFLTEGFEPWVASSKLDNVLPRGDQEPRLDIIRKK